MISIRPIDGVQVSAGERAQLYFKNDIDLSFTVPREFHLVTSLTCAGVQGIGEHRLNGGIPIRKFNSWSTMVDWPPLVPGAALIIHLFNKWEDRGPNLRQACYFDIYGSILLESADSLPELKRPLPEIWRRAHEELHNR
jgi:hypothetical protein